MKMLIAERGLKDTRRNRRWLKLIYLLDVEGVSGQERREALAWKILRSFEDTF